MTPYPTMQEVLLDLAQGFAETVREIRAQPTPTESAQQFIADLTSDVGWVAHEGHLVFWLRTEDDKLVAWGGNEYDFDMNKLVEVQL